MQVLPVVDGLAAIKAALVRGHPHAIGHGSNMVMVDPQADDTVGVLSGNAVAACVAQIHTAPATSAPWCAARVCRARYRL